MEMLNEYQNINLEELIKSIAKVFPREELNKIIEEYHPNSQKKCNDSFQEIDMPKNIYSLHKISSKDLDNLKDDETVTEIKGLGSFYITIDDENKKIDITSNIGKEKIQFLYPLTKQDVRSFALKYRRKNKFFGEATVLYSPTLNIFSLHQIKIYMIQTPFEKWKQLMEQKSLRERVHILLTILGLNAELLLYHEKIIPIERLIPLVVKKVLLIELSRKMVAKTHSYQSLDFNVYNTAVTRANAFIDGRKEKEGNFFYEDTAFIVDEIHRITDLEFITAMQIYMNGEKYEGEIQVSGNDRRKTDVSICILGNIKTDTDLLYLFSDNQIVKEKYINLFSNTIIMSSPDGEAFVSRITAIPNSWGCRDFASSMKLDEGTDFYNLELLKAVIPILREKEFDIKSFYQMMEISGESPSFRSSEAVEKNFEGFIKLLYPEFLDGVTPQQAKQHHNEFKFLYERAVEMRKIVDNQLKIINPNSNKELTFPYLNTQLRNVMFTIKEPHYFTPHRIFIECGDGNIKKIPLDVMGIEMNKREVEILEALNLKIYDNNNNQLIHNSNYTRNYLLQNNRSFNSIGFPLAIQSSQSYGNINFSPSNDSKITMGINYNYLTGEYENLELYSANIISEYSFYDLSY